jgi:hypothetical protein
MPRRVSGWQAETGNRWLLGLGTRLLGEVAWRERDSNCHRLLDDAMAILREVGDPWAMAEELWLLGCIGLAEGDYPAAGESFNGALAIERELARKQGIAHNLVGLGWVALHKGDAAEAESVLTEAVEVELEVGRPPRIAEGLEGLAAAAACQHQPERALLLLGAADAAWEAMGRRMAFFERAAVDGWLVPARHALGETVADMNYSDGRSMSLRDVSTWWRPWPPQPIHSCTTRTRCTPQAISRAPFATSATSWVNGASST